MNIYVNNAVHNGIQNYLSSGQNMEIDKVHIFEYWVVKVLVQIYGEINIINPFKLNNVESLQKNLTLYGLKTPELEAFFRYMEEYDKWLNSPTLVPKTDLPIKLSTTLINMVLLRNGTQKITAEDIAFYDTFFDPIEGHLAKLNDLIVTDKTVIPKLWRRKKAQLENRVILEEVMPDLLPASDYKRYGLNINEVKQLSNLKIKEINDKILAEDAAANEGGRAKFDPKKLILTSGSGFVDTLVLLSIMATEIMVGLLIAFSFLKR